MMTSDALTLGRVFGGAVLDLLYPTRCAACDQLGMGVFCSDCRYTVQPVPDPSCARCGSPGVTGLCSGCRVAPPAFILARSAGLFNHSLQRVIHALKYERRQRVAVPLADLLEDAWKRESKLRPANLLIPLPLHPTRERDRGFNQSALLAVEFGRRLNLPVAEDALVRSIYRRPQVGLGRDERRTNVKGVFDIKHPERIKGRSILLIDDVMTTGATCSEAARTLLDAGAREVRVLTLAREP